MLIITIPGLEFFDEKLEEFITDEDVNLELEHSLTSISDWESKWNKPFIHNTDKTIDEIIDYVKCMSINKNLSDDVYDRLTNGNIKQINEYIELPMTATTFTNNKQSGGREIITSELIYYWMISYNIPFECQHWHLNKLLTLIKVCNIKNNPPTKMSDREIYNRNRNLNAERRKQMQSKG